MRGSSLDKGITSFLKNNQQMKRKIVCNKIYYNLFLLFLFSILHISLYAQSNVNYKNPKLTSDQRSHDLITRMTLEEKVGQLLCPLGWEMYNKQAGDITVSEKYKQQLIEYHTGMFWAVYRADPWTKKTLINGLNPNLAAKAGNAMQRYAIENTRLGIPIFIAEEAPHGHMAIGTTVFPVGIGLASTWNTSLIEEVATAISKEIRSQGGHISYGPVLDLIRDPRWSRVEESYGEDPVLTAKMGAAYVKGTGAGDLSKPYSAISTLKHFIAYGIPEGGHNGNTALIGERELRENFLPPFKSAIENGALSVMTAYNSIDGVPCTSNKFLLTNVLRNEWQFDGFVVSDLVSIDGIMKNHYVAETLSEAATLSLSAGVDVDLGANAFVKLVDSAKKGKIDQATIDKAVYRILKLKFDMGLFDNPYVNPQAATDIVRSSAHIDLARRTARESIVLLENRNNILPLSKDIKRIAVIGPNADSRYNQLGDYTAPQEDNNIKTVLDGVTAQIGKSKIEYVKGCAIRDTTDISINEAVAAAKRAEVAIVVVGGSSARDFKTEYKETGAAIATDNTLSDMESGEGFDRSTLDLLGKQLDLLKVVKATGTPLIVIYIQGRPLNMNWAASNADALLNAWYPGQEGGNALADVLFGNYNPAGRLPISVPRSVGQIPVYYNKKKPREHDYVEGTATPLYSFGYGLSYTTFEYGKLSITAKDRTTFSVSFSLRNTGNVAGDEVVQLYLDDEVASVVQPIKQLKHFQRINLKPKEKKLVTFTLTADDLTIINHDMKPEVEAGSFKIMIGSSSDNITLESKIVVEE